MSESIKVSVRYSISTVARKARYTFVEDLILFLVMIMMVMELPITPIRMTTGLALGRA